MKIVLAGGYDTQNLGDHGMLAVFGRDLKKLDPEIEIVLLSRHPDPVFDETYGVRSILNLDHKTKKDSFGRWFYGLNYGDDTSHLQTIWEELETSDLLVIGGGRLFVDITLDFMRGPLPYYALLVTLAKFLGKPIMIFAMTIVPVRTAMGREYLKYIVSNADLITVREDASKQELKKLGIPDYRIRVIPDPALGLEFEDRIEQGLRILSEEGIDAGNKRFIGLNFRFTHLDFSISEKNYKLLANICDELYENLGLDILLISQMTYNVDNPYDDDRELYRIIRNRCNNQKNIHLLNSRYNVWDTLSMYHCCEMIYSMRRHGIIFAATQFIPVFALSGEENTSYPMYSFGLSKYIINFSKLIKGEAIKNLISAYEERDEIKKSLYKYLPELRNQTIKYAQSVVEVINKKEEKHNKA